MNNERYNQIIDEAYGNYTTHMNNNLSETRWHKTWISDDGKSVNGRQYTKEEFINKSKIDSDFSERWGFKIEERELTLEERYNKWFNNNYETGMERYFDPNDLPDFNNPYYEPTPTKVITVTYQGEKIEVFL